ncbi:MAG TPA: hypothetical protein VE987_11325 [Polyangiaceae bacterium]|nr:hypothetical protein [Polyangiaceae bacterium]
MRVRASLAGLLLALLLCSCSGGLPHARYAPQVQASLVEVDAPPPPGRVEAIPISPSSSAVWIDGEWRWRRGRWAWSPGRWVQAPPGATFSPWVFVRGADGRLWCAPGTWRDARGAPMDAPLALATAAVNAAEVVGANGAIEATGRTR